MTSTAIASPDEDSHRTVTYYQWNNANQLTAVSGAGGEATYGYDAFGRMVSETENGATDYFIDDGQSVALVMNVVNGYANVVERELYGPAVDQVLASEFPPSVPSGGGSQSSGPVNWLLTDNQGTVHDVVQYTASSNTTAVIDHLIYDSFGQLTSQTNATYQPRFTYAGMQLDPVSGLYYDNARWYDALNGVFISQDPLGFAAGDPNTSRYCFNSPTNGTDPSGMVWKTRAQMTYQESESVDQAMGAGLGGSTQRVLTSASDSLRDLFKFTRRYRVPDPPVGIRRPPGHSSGGGVPVRGGSPGIGGAITQGMGQELINVAKGAVVGVAIVTAFPWAAVLMYGGTFFAGYAIGNSLFQMMTGLQVDGFGNLTGKSLTSEEIAGLGGKTVVDIALGLGIVMAGGGGSGTGGCDGKITCFVAGTVLVPDDRELNPPSSRPRSGEYRAGRPGLAAGRGDDHGGDRRLSRRGKEGQTGREAPQGDA